jgi:opacity protein-like surface antigen
MTQEIRMRRHPVASLTTACLSVGLAAAASAADLSRPAHAPLYTKAPDIVPFSWAGFYVGGNVDYGWGTSKNGPSFTQSSTPNFATSGATKLTL